jgi:TPR repeat protein
MPDRGVAGDGLPGARADRAARVICSHCGTDLTFLPPGARFCRHCGVRLSLEPLTGTSRTRSDVFTQAVSSWWYWWWGGAPRVQQSPAGDRSFMLIAYAKSMFGLGWRYEHAVGSRRNLNEAARCYDKAAKLGNPDAAGRLRRAHARDDGLSSRTAAEPPPLADVWQGGNGRR